MITKDEIIDKLKSDYKIDSNGCWLWNGYKYANGYGGIRLREGRREKVHRLSLHVFKDFDLSSKLHVLHKCNVKHCFNPEHLYVGTHTNNMRDRMTNFCRRGHEYTPENTYITTSGDRSCRACIRRSRLKSKGLLK